MPLDRFLIGFNTDSSGLTTNLRPWLIADDAFSFLKNAYVFRGRVRKRTGSVLLGDSPLNSRLRVQVGTVGAPSSPVPGGALAAGQLFSVGSEIYTVYQNGAMLASVVGTSGTATLATGAFTINSLQPGATPIYWYPALPVMGITQYETSPINDEPTIAWDTQFAYQFDAATTNGWERIGTGAAATWTGSNSDFFWAANYQGATPNINLLFATNFTDADGIRYWNGTAWTTTAFQYAAGGTDTIVTARIIVVFKNRLLFLNTRENVSGTPTSFPQRCRYSAVGSPLATNAWRQDIPGNGSAIDAPTQEAIVTAQFLKDRLIVYFERSTWELVYTGNQVYPFVWQKINTELGAESTFSQVPFDKAVLGIGNVGIHACNGANVDRIDAKIPDLIFRFHNQNQGLERIAGIRDYGNEIVYWTYPITNRDSNFPFPNQVLVYNYVNNAWAINDDSITAFGYFQVGSQTPGGRWGDTDSEWGETNTVWNSALNTVKSRRIMAGNQQGWTVLLNDGESRNAEALQITTLALVSPGIIDLEVYNHNLEDDSWVYLENLNGITMTDSNGDVLPSAIAQVINDPVTNAQPNALRLQALDNQGNDIIFTGTYTGGGTLARVSEIGIATKQYNFYTPHDRNVFLPKVDFMVDRTTNGQITVDYLISSSIEEMIEQGEATGALLGSGVLETSPYSAALVPFEQTQTRLWHPVYFQAEGECVQLQFYFSPTQMRLYTYDEDLNIPLFSALQDFQLHAMIVYAQATAARMQ